MLEEQDIAMEKEEKAYRAGAPNLFLKAKPKNFAGRTGARKPAIICINLSVMKYSHLSMNFTMAIQISPNLSWGETSYS